MTFATFVSTHTPVVRRRVVGGVRRSHAARTRRFSWMRHAADVSSLDNPYVGIEYHRPPVARKDAGWQRPC